MKSSLPYILTIIISLSILVNCNLQNDNNTDIVEVFTSDVDGDTVRHSKMVYFDFDTILDLTGFFNGLSVRYPIVRWMSDDDEDGIDKDIIDCITEIEAYRKGKRRDYPKSTVNHCIRHMGFNIAAVNNHSGGADCVLAEWVMMCAAFYAPDITCLVETQTPDHCAGVYNFGNSYNPNLWWPYLFLKREKGFEVIFLGDYTKVCSIIQLIDAKEKKYYLCSNNTNATEFHQWLFCEENKSSYRKVAEYSSIPYIESEETLSYSFNPHKLIWNKFSISKGNDNLNATSYDHVLSLELDGENSIFIEP